MGAPSPPSSSASPRAGAGGAASPRKPALDNNGKTNAAAETTTTSFVSPARKRLLIVACLCILGNEFCERLAYYGLSGNLSLYLKKELGYTAASASQALQAWKGFVYLSPVLGAYLADARWGKYLVIVVFSSVYFFGMALLALANLVPSLKPVNGGPPPGAPTIPIFWLAMTIMGFGSGGIKPCVSSFGADQFCEKNETERAWRTSFFNWFYMSINVGSLIATLLIVPLQESKGYGIGFGVPTLTFAVAIVAFLLGTSLYTRLPPQGSPFSRLGCVLKTAFRNRRLPLPSDPAELYEESPAEAEAKRRQFEQAQAEIKAAAQARAAEEVPLTSARSWSGSFSKLRRDRAGGLFNRRARLAAEPAVKPPVAPIDRIPHTEGMRFLDKAAIRTSAELPVTAAAADEEHEHAHAADMVVVADGAVGCCGLSKKKTKKAKKTKEPVTVSMVEESKAFYRLMPIFALVCIWQMTYDPVFTLFPFPGDVMERTMGSVEIPAATISFANTFGGES
jgi:hypothetical protein